VVELTQLLLLGAFSGFVAGLLGVGGGLIMVPALLYLLAGDITESALMHTSIGTALAVIVFTSFSSVWAHHKHSAIHWHNFKKLTPTILLGAFSGSIVALVINGSTTRLSSFALGKVVLIVSCRNNEFAIFLNIALR